MNKRTVFIGFVVFLVGGIAGFSLSYLSENEKTGCVSNFLYVNPEPDCEVYDERSEKLSDLQATLETKVRELELQNDIDHVAIFTRDLTSRRFAGKNDDRVFVLASLLKVPILISYYKFAEVEPAILSDEVLYTGTPDSYGIQTEIPPEERLSIGQRYTIEELLSRMIIHSDNTASDILLPRMTDSLYGKNTFFAWSPG